MPPELKAALERESKINLRSLNAEVVDRLQKSLQTKPMSSYKAESPPTGAGYQSDITDVERQLLTLFRKQRPDKQLAIITVLS